MDNHFHVKEPQFEQKWHHFIIFIYDLLQNIIDMKRETTPQLIGIIAIIVGILMLIYPQLVGYLVGIFLIAYGILEVIK